MRKPHKPDQASLAFGEIGARQNPHTVPGAIAAVHPNTYTCDVRTNQGEILIGLPFPNLNQDPRGRGGEVTVPRVGQKVVVQRGMGQDFITQTIPIYSPITASELTGTSVGSGTSTPSLVQQNGLANYRRNMPAQLVPGDWVRAGSQGQYISVLDGGSSGGSVVMHGSHWSQVSAHGSKDTVHINAKNLKVETGFGRLDFRDENGKPSFALRGGTDQTTETGVDRGNWTIRADIADGQAKYGLFDRKGNALATRGISPQGDVSDIIRGEHNTRVAGPSVQTYANERHIVVQDGADSHEVLNGDRTERFGGNHDSRVSQNRTSFIFNDRSDMIQRDWVQSVGRALTASISGDPITGTPGSAAALWQVTNGSVEFDIGQPPLDTGIAQSGFVVNVKTLTGGDIDLSTALGKFIASTTLPDSVLLGANAGVATFHACMWEPFQALMQAVVKWLATHTHPSGTGPTGTPIVPPGSILNPLIGPVRSTKVMIGG